MQGAAQRVQQSLQNEQKQKTHCNIFCNISIIYIPGCMCNVEDGCADRVDQLVKVQHIAYV